MRRIALSLLLIVMLLPLSRAGSGRTEYIVTLKPGQSITAVNKDAGTQTVRGIAGTSIYLVSRASDDDDGHDDDHGSDSSDKVLKKIKGHNAVESAEANGRIKLNAASDDDSSGLRLNQALSDLLDGDTRTSFYGTSVLRAYSNQPALDITRISAVRGISTGAATRVAYIDTGVDMDHPALKPWLETGVDLVSRNSVSEMDGLGQAMSDLLDHAMSDLLDDRFIFFLNRLGSDSSMPSAFGHGTMVAGLIHVAAPQARIYPIKAFDAWGYTSMFQIVEGVYAAINADADVLNMSFSTEQDSGAFHKALDSARAAGISLVAAVGNEGRDARNLYPAAYTGVYGVAATDLNDKATSFTNYGKSVAVTAPGAFVISTAPGGRYAVAWGTSFSSPLVAGSIALLNSSKGHGQADGAAIVNTADSIDARNPGFEGKLGKGRINLQQALKVRQ